jgi:hypothetical protein
LRLPTNKLESKITSSVCKLKKKRLPVSMN